MKTGIDEYKGKTMNCTYWLPLSSSDIKYSYPDELDENSGINVAWNVREDEQASANDHEAPSFLNIFLQSDKSSEPFQSSDGGNLSSQVTAMALIKFAPQADSASLGFLSTAHICALSVCAKEYNMSMTSGIFRTEIVSTSYSEFGGPTLIDQKNAGNPSYRFTFSDDLNNNFTVDSYLKNTISVNMIINDTSSGDPSSGDPITPIFFDLDSGPPISGYAISDDSMSRGSKSRGSMVTIAFTFEDKMAEVLQQTFGGILRLDYDLSSVNNWLADPTNIYLSGLNTSINIPKTMDRVAAAMSNRLRDLSNVTVQGQSEFMKLYIRVSWWWILLPISTVVFATIFLISIAITTRKHKMPIWKTSELALLFHGPDLSSLGGNSVEMLKASEMEDIASALRVKFGHDSETGVPKLERMSEQEK